MKKSVKIIVVLIVISILFTAFTAERRLPRCPDGAISVFVDPATGVNYLVYDPGYGPGGIALRVNRDGTPMVTK